MHSVHTDNHTIGLTNNLSTGSGGQCTNWLSHGALTRLESNTAISQWSALFGTGQFISAPTAHRRSFNQLNLAGVSFSQPAL